MAGIRARGVVVLLMVCSVPAAAQTTAAAQGAARVVRHQAPTDRVGWEMGIRIGDARTGWINAFVLYPWGDPRKTPGDGAEFVAVDKNETCTAANPSPSGCRNM